MRDRLPTKSARWDNRPKAVPDPDLEITGTRRRGAVSKKFFGAFGCQFGLKIRGGGPLGPLDPPLKSFSKDEATFQMFSPPSQS